MPIPDMPPPMMITSFELAMVTGSQNEEEGKSIPVETLKIARGRYRYVQGL